MARDATKQGTDHHFHAMNATGALGQLGVNTANLTVSVFGAAVNQATFNSIVSNAGANVGYFKVNPYDAVATVIGGNAPSAGSFIGSIVCAPLLFTNTMSSHGSYSYFGQ